MLRNLTAFFYGELDSCKSFKKKTKPNNLKPNKKVDLKRIYLFLLA